MISIICIYDHRKAYNEKLGQSLILLEDCAYELIVKKRVGNIIDNLNEAIIQAHNDLILVAREEVFLPSNLMEYIKAFQDLNFGAVGCRGRSKELVEDGICHIVSDECYLIRRSDYLEYPFDKECKQHYLIDYCYAMMSRGKKNYVINIPQSYQHEVKDDDVIICHIGLKYHQKEIDTMNDYYPIYFQGRIIKLVDKIKNRIQKQRG